MQHSGGLGAPSLQATHSTHGVQGHAQEYSGSSRALPEWCFTPDATEEGTRDCAQPPVSSLHPLECYFYMR